MTMINVIAMMVFSTWETGIVTLMLRDHVLSGGPVACKNHPKVKRILPKDSKIRNDFALAALRNAKKYPCGSLIEYTLMRTGKHATAMVVDRGTAGVTCEGKRRLATHKELKSNELPLDCAWNAGMDLNLGGHQAVNSDGYELMRWRPLDKKLRTVK